MAKLMEKKLKENDHKGGWDNESLDWLVGRLKEEVGELEYAIDIVQLGHSTIDEAVDVANFAMMIVSLISVQGGDIDD
jgi:NTP pyrophosphatase (non-canonical NTP hydrolase)